MRISVLTIGAIASIIAINSVVADTKSTVTSRGYVDAQDALKQNKIPATGTNANTPGETVVTYTDTAGTIGERGIFDGADTYDILADRNKLVTAGLVQTATDCIYQNLQQMECTEWVANADHTDENCLLMTVRTTVDFDCDPFSLPLIPIPDITN